MLQSMRRLAIVAIVLCTAVSAQAEEGTKIALINSQRIFNEYQEARDADAVYQEEMRGWQQELEGMERELIGLQEQIRSQAQLLSRERLDALQSDYDQKLQAYEQRRFEIMDPEQGQAVTRNAELSAPINEQISTVVERLAAEGDFDLVLDSAVMTVVYAADGMDLTELVLEELGKGTEE